MSQEIMRTPSELETKEVKYKDVLIEVAKWRRTLSILGAGALAISAFDSAHDKNHVDKTEGGSNSTSEVYPSVPQDGLGAENKDLGNINEPSSYSYYPDPESTYYPDPESKEVPFSYTVQGLDGIFRDLDKKILLGEVSPEKMDILRNMIKQND
jgi:hypothetical protein